jgi:hypothetical protein
MLNTAARLFFRLPKWLPRWLRMLPVQCTVLVYRLRRVLP